MSTRTTSNLTRQPGVIDRFGLRRNSGRQIDWDRVADSRRETAQTVKLNGAAAIGATSLTVDALPVKLLAGAILDFGHIDNVPVALSAAAAEGATSLSVTALTKALPAGAVLDFGAWAAVVVTASAALKDATTLGCSALSGPLPNGAVLDFGSQKYAKLTAAAATGATSLTVAALPTAISGSETATFPAQDKLATVATAAAEGDTSIAVVALPVPLAATDTAAWKGGTQQARVTANAAKGATSVTVDELQFRIADDSEAIVGGLGYKSLKPLTVMAELSTGKIIPRADVTGAETASCVLESGAAENDVNLTGYGCLIGGGLYENLMPDAVAGDVSGTYKTELAAAGCNFFFEDYGDNTTT